MNITYLTSLFYLTIGVIIILLGIIIFKENFRQRINRITGVMMFFAGTGPIFAAFGLLLQQSPAANMDLEVFRKIFLVWEFFFPQMLLFSMVFPRQLGWPKKHRYLVYLIYFPHLIHFLLILSFSSPDQVSNLIDLQALSDRFGLIIQPLTIFLGLLLSLLSLMYEFHTNFFALINLIYIIAAISLMLWGYRSLENPRFKKQVGLVLWGIRASVGLYAIAFIFPHLNILHTSQLVAYLLTSGALLIGAGSIAWAIIRYQFLDIRLIIRRGLIFSMASAVLIGIYLMIYGQGKKFITGILNIQIPVLEVLFIILALLFFQPILNYLEQILERIFMKDRMDYRNVLQDLSHDIMTTLDMNELQEKITSSLKGALSLENVYLLVSSRKDHFILNTEEEQFQFDMEEEWIRILKERDGPIGFDELSAHVAEDHSLDKLRKLNPYLFIPLIYRSQLVGILILGEKIAKTNFTSEDMTILSVLSNQAAIALENAELYKDMLEKQRIEEEIGLAREIQINLLPRVFPSGDRFELTGYNLPSREIGGDYYDFITLNEHKIGIAIGDVAGKGIPAAILMSNLQAALRISAARSVDTREAIQEVNIHITRTTTPEKFATFFYSVFDTRKLTLQYTNAGHNYPILCRTDGSHEFLKEGGIIVGVMEGALYQARTVSLYPGDVLVLYTDGITESLNPENEQFGEDLLVEIVRKSSHLSAQNLLDFILDRVIEFTHGYLQADDLTLVVLKVK